MYKIYYTNEYGEARSYDETSLTEALTIVEGLRRNSRNSFITMVAQHANQVGLMGVDSVQDGLLPSGEKYTWKMRRT
jgi:hypothetical protein